MLENSTHPYHEIDCILAIVVVHMEETLFFHLLNPPQFEKKDNHESKYVMD
jgi:hypothetical protein